MDSRLLCLWDFPGNNTGVGYYFLFQGIFWTQESNPGFDQSPALQADSLLTELQLLFIFNWDLVDLQVDLQVD